MKLIVGLGNPGGKYESTWHNAGFLALDELHKEGFDDWRSSSKHKLIAAEGQIGNEKAMLVKPQTYMNKSGEAVQAISNFYKVDVKDVYVIHDELDLPLGKIRVSDNSSAGGNNGVASIIKHLSSKEFARIRIGIRTDQTEKMPADKYVLKKIGLLDKMTLNKVIKKSVVPAIFLILEKGTAEAKNQYN